MMFHNVSHGNDSQYQDATPSQYSARQLIRECIHEVAFPVSQEANNVIDAIVRWKEQLPQEMTLASLYQFESMLQEKHNASVEFFKHCIQLLDPGAVASRVGLDPLIWAHLSETRMRTPGVNDHRSYLKQHGLDVGRMQVAAASHRMILDAPAHTSVAMATYELGTMVQDGGSLLRCREALASWSRPGKSYSLEMLQEFKLEGVCIEEGYPYGKRHRYGSIAHDIAEGDIFHAFYLDAPVALVLSHQGAAVAFVACLASTKDSLLVNEIQAVRPRRLLSEESTLEIEALASHHWELEPYQWRPCLVQLLAQVARPLGFTRVGIQSAQNNRWTMPEHGEIHLPRARATQIYDSTARTLGMQLADDGNFYGRIESVLRAGSDVPEGAL